jgi:glutamyl-tRNA reductase
MNTQAHPIGRAFVIGANHRTSRLSFRDRLFVENKEVPKFLDELRQIGLVDGMLLVTCDRVEVMGMHLDPEALFPDVLKVFAAHADVPDTELNSSLYLRLGSAAVRHLFSVTASLDSLVIGEPQVLGQVKAAHRMAKDVDMIRGPFESLLQSAYGVAKRVRTETAIGESPVSIVSVACEVARALHGGLAPLNVVLMGRGEMGELIARQFRDNGVKGLTVSHPNLSFIAPLAKRLGCNITPFDKLSDALAEADIIICAMGDRRHILSVDMVKSALKARRNRPQLIIDTAIPGDVEPAVNKIDDAFLYELSDLEQVTFEGRTNREAEADTAKIIIEEAVSKYLTNNESRGAIHTLNQLRNHFEAIQKVIIDENPNDAARATELLISRLLHRPSQVLRELATQGKTEITEADNLLSVLFGLKNNSEEDEQ